MARYRILPSHNGAIDYDRAVEADAIEPLADGSAALTMTNQDIVAIIPAGYLIFREQDEAETSVGPGEAVAQIKRLLAENTIGYDQATEIGGLLWNNVDWSTGASALAGAAEPPTPPVEAYDIVAAEEASKEEPEG